MQQKVYLLYPVLVVKTPSIHTKQQTIDIKFIYLQLTELFFFCWAISFEKLRAAYEWHHCRDHTPELYFTRDASWCFVEWKWVHLKEKISSFINRLSNFTSQINGDHNEKPQAISFNKKAYLAISVLHLRRTKSGVHSSIIITWLFSVMRWPENLPSFITPAMYFTGMMPESETQLKWSKF